MLAHTRDSGQNLTAEARRRGETKTFETQRNGGSGGNRKTKAYRGSTRIWFYARFALLRAGLRRKEGASFASLRHG
jgi:hypothetical protein